MGVWHLYDLKLLLVQLRNETNKGTINKIVKISVYKLHVFIIVAFPPDREPLTTKKVQQFLYLFLLVS